MYPEGTLIDSKYKTLAVFEKDLNNPENEGFICFWKVKKSFYKKLIFKKRLSKIQALNKFNDLLRKGWSKKILNNKAA